MAQKRGQKDRPGDLIPMRATRKPRHQSPARGMPQQDHRRAAGSGGDQIGDIILELADRGHIAPGRGIGPMATQIRRDAIGKPRIRNFRT